MRRFVPLMVAVLVGAVAWVFFGNFKIAGIGDLRVVPQHAEVEPAEPSSNSLSDSFRKFVGSKSFGKNTDASPRADGSGKQSQRLKIGTFNLDAFNVSKAQNPNVMEILARIGREFDILAVQEIRADADDLLPRLVQLMNKKERKFDFAIGERVGPKGLQSQYGFIFNGEAVELDRSELYTIDDRDDLLSYEPFVAWFRARGISQETAFTFSLVNIQLEPTTVRQERDVLSQVMFAVREDGRNEDDIIMLGDFQTPPGSFGKLEELNGITFALTQVPTDVEGTATLDNLIFWKTATSEFTGNSGVFDFLREFNLDLEDALKVSKHLPVWAEFTLFEGGQAGRIAQQPKATSLR